MYEQAVQEITRLKKIREEALSDVVIFEKLQQKWTTSEVTQLAQRNFRDALADPEVHLIEGRNPKEAYERLCQDFPKITFPSFDEMVLADKLAYQINNNTHQRLEKRPENIQKQIRELIDSTIERLTEVREAKASRIGSATNLEARTLTEEVQQLDSQMRQLNLMRNPQTGIRPSQVNASTFGSKGPTGPGRAPEETPQQTPLAT